jgi:hypothetical protein
MSESDTNAPGFTVKKESTVKMPIYLLFGILTVTVSAALMWANLSREVAEQARINLVQDGRCQRLEEALTEERRVNNAQDHRFENLEASQSDLPIIRNDMKWLLKRDEQHRP